MLRLDGGDADVIAAVNTAGRERVPFLTWEHAAAASRLLNKPSTHRITGELVDSKVLLKGAFSADHRSMARWIGDRSPRQWSDGASLTIVLLLSLGFWAAIWQAVASLVSASLL